MAFEFRLQKLLEYRENQQRLEQEKLARRQRELLSVQQELDRLRDEEQRLLQDNSRGPELHIPELMLRDNYSVFLRESFRKREAELKRGEEHVKRQRYAVLEAWRSCRVLSTLREKAYAEYREEQKIIEQRLHDELGVNCFLKRDNKPDSVD